MWPSLFSRLESRVTGQPTSVDILFSSSSLHAKDVQDPINTLEKLSTASTQRDIMLGQLPR